ncbi:hypothetical protein ACWEJ6_11520 [Nonomuraea sp. NPDC004702]
MLADLIGTAAMVAAPVFTANLWTVAAAAFLGGMGPHHQPAPRPPAFTLFAVAALAVIVPFLRTATPAALAAADAAAPAA